MASLHSGLPISVVVGSRLASHSASASRPTETTYVFNVSGQSIDLSGLIYLFDAEGPCANAVKDAQRTKTSPDTRRTLRHLGQRPCRRAERQMPWYRELLERRDNDGAC